MHVLAARLARKPVVIRIMVDGAWEISHRYGWCGGDDIVSFQTRSYGWKVGLTRHLQKRWWRAAKHIIACSEFLRQILIRTYGVPPENLATQGYGERYLKIDTDGDERANRRVTIRRITSLVKPAEVSEN